MKITINLKNSTLSEIDALELVLKTMKSDNVLTEFKLEDPISRKSANVLITLRKGTSIYGSKIYDVWCSEPK